MDTEQIIAHSRARFEHAAARRVLKEKYQAKLTFAHAGGMWRAGPELLTLLQACTEESELVLEDLYGTPVKVNTTELHQMAFVRWQEQMNAWLVDYDQLNRQR